MSDENPNELEEIEATVWKVLTLAYLRPLLKGSKVEPFQLSDEERANMLEGYESNLASDMEILSECLKAACSIGASGEVPQGVNDTIVLKGNNH